MKEVLEHLFKHNTLSSGEAKEMLTKISEGNFNAYQISSFLTVFRILNLKSIGQLFKSCRADATTCYLQEKEQNGTTSQ